MAHLGQAFDGPNAEKSETVTACLPEINPKYAQPKRNRMKDRKLDVGRAYQMRYAQGMTFAEIGKLFDCSPSTVHERLTTFEAILPDPHATKLYEEHRPNLLTAVEHQLVCDMADPERRAKASLNNTAYALTQVSNLRRLEQGKATSHVAILQLAAQQADTGDVGV
jgi:hypothetical protein